MIKMLDYFYGLLRMAKYNSKFLTIVWRNQLCKKLVWYIFKCHKSNTYYRENVKRVNVVANMLADEKSKKTYLGMIKFRQTYKKKDFPISCYEKEQYFIEELEIGNDEVFVDCGAYNGDTIDEFLKRFLNYKQIIAFEPQQEMFDILSKKHGKNPKITLINAGVSDKDGDVLFEIHGYGSKIIEPLSKVTDDFIVIKTKTIDGLNLQNVSFIKMDIEGAELNALKGAEKTILRDKPKLAICIYHSDDDMIRIAEYIHDLLPEYKLYVKQHFEFLFEETVLYALP